MDHEVLLAKLVVEGGVEVTDAEDCNITSHHGVADERPGKIRMMPLRAQGERRGGTGGATVLA